MLAMVDANYKFIAIDVGSFGREGDSGIFLKSAMGQQILDESFGFPEKKIYLDLIKLRYSRSSIVLRYSRR